MHLHIYRDEQGAKGEKEGGDDGQKVEEKRKRGKEVRVGRTEYVKRCIMNISKGKKEVMIKLQQWRNIYKSWRLKIYLHVKL